MTVKNKSKIIIMSSDMTNSTNSSPKRGKNIPPSPGRGGLGEGGNNGGGGGSVNEDEHAIIESIDQCVACTNGVDLHVLEGQARSDLNAVLRRAAPSTPRRNTSEGRTAAPPTPEQMSLRRELQYAGAAVCKPQPSGCCVTGAGAVAVAVAGGSNVDGAADASSTSPPAGGALSPPSPPAAHPPPTCRDDVDVTSDGGADGEGGDFGSMLRDYELCADRSQVCEPSEGDGHNISGGGGGGNAHGHGHGPLVMGGGASSTAAHHSADRVLAARMSSSSDMSDLRIAATTNTNSAGAPIGGAGPAGGNFAIDRRMAGAASAGANKSCCAVCWEVPPGGAPPPTSVDASPTAGGGGGGKHSSSSSKRTYFYAKETTKPHPASHHHHHTEIHVATTSRRDGFASLPCCGGRVAGGPAAAATTTTRICTGCILILCTPTSDGASQIGRCPLCREWISVTPLNASAAATVADDASLASSAGTHASVATNNTKRSSEGTATAEEGSSVVIRRVDAAGQCRVCNQVKDRLVDSGGGVCDCCYLGMRCPLLYECSQCHAVQRIPHPMYRYQVSVDRFGEKSWACNAQCNNFSFWRIVPSQVGLIPAGDAPLDWGHDYVETAREKVMEVRRQIRESPSGGVGGVGVGVQGGSGGDWCAIS